MMAAHFLFCPGSSDTKKQKTKANKLKHFNFKSATPVDPLYETIPARTKYSENNRGRHTFDQTGRQPLSLRSTSKQPATVLSSHSPSASHAGQSQELSVASGETVFVLHQDQGWSYVVNKQNRMGYVPSTVLGGREEDNSTAELTGTRSETLVTNTQSPPATPSGSVYSRANKQRRSRSSSHSSLSTRILAASPQQNSDHHNSFTTFSKSPREIRALLHSYMSTQENDLSVRKGEQVTVLNGSDQDWLWVVRGDGEEGFVPASFTIPVSSNNYGNGSIVPQHKHSKLTKQHSYSTGYRSSSSVTNSNNQLSAAFSDHLRVTPVRSLPHSPVNGVAPCFLQPVPEPNVDNHVSQRRRKSPERIQSRENRSKTPDGLGHNRTNSLEYSNKKYRNVNSPIPQVSELQRTSSLQRSYNSPNFAAQNARQFGGYNQPVQRPTRPAPSPPEEYIYQNLRLVYPNPVQALHYPQHPPQSGLYENIYVNTIGLDANGKPSLVPSIMTMQERVQLLDKNPMHFPHSTSDNSLGHTSSLGDITSVSEFNQHYVNSRLLKEDMV